MMLKTLIGVKLTEKQLLDKVQNGRRRGQSILLKGYGSQLALPNHDGEAS